MVEGRGLTTPFKQLITHDPDNKQYGDCYRTAIGCLLDIPPDGMPHFVEQSMAPDNELTSAQLADLWLKTRGYCLWTVPFIAELEEMLSSMEEMNPGVYYLLSGTSKLGTGHSVVARGDKIVWDPSKQDTGIVGPMEDGYFWIELILPRLMVGG